MTHRAGLSQSAALFQLPSPFHFLPAYVLHFPCLPLSLPPIPWSPPLPQSGVRNRAPAAVAFCCIVCSQNASGLQHFWFFDTLYFWYRIFRVQSCAPLKFAALFGRTPQAGADDTASTLNKHTI